MEVSPVILSAIISAAIATLTLIISTSITLRKNNHEERSYFEKNLKEKLENIYLPLHLDITRGLSIEPLIKEATEDLIYKYGYLLDPTLLNELRELIHFEKNEPDFLAKIEYLALRCNVIDDFKKEFASLQTLYNSHFESYRQKYTMAPIIKLKNRVMRIFIAITFIVYGVAGSVAIYYFMNNISKTPANPILNAIVGFMIMITMITTGLGIGTGITKYMEWLEKRIGKKRNAYKFSDRVPSTGEYQCRACKKTIIKVEYTTFGYCNDHTRKQVWKSIFNLGLWEKLQ